jgi:hypothetical protein
MATRQSLSGGNFAANAIGFIPPAISGLNRWLLFGNASGDNTNLAPGASSLTNVGTGPVLHAGYGTFTPTTAALDTGLADTAGILPMSFMFAARTGSTTAAAIFGTYAGGTKGYELEFNSSSNALRLVISGTYIQTQAAVGGAVSAFRLYGVVIPATGGVPVMYDLTSQATYTGTTLGAYTANTGHNLQIGQYPEGIDAGNSTDLAFWADWNGVLTLSQLNSQAASVRFTLAARGVVV